MWRGSVDNQAQIALAMAGLPSNSISPYTQKKALFYVPITTMLAVSARRPEAEQDGTKQASTSSCNAALASSFLQCVDSFSRTTKSSRRAMLKSSADARYVRGFHVQIMSISNSSASTMVAEPSTTPAAWYFTSLDECFCPSSGEACVAQAHLGHDSGQP